MARATPWRVPSGVGHESGERSRLTRTECALAHLSPQWLRRLISTVRSPSKMCLSSWFTP